MSSCKNVLMINQSTTAYVNRFFWILLQYSYLPWIFSEFTVTINVNGILDASGNPLGIAATTLTKVLFLLANWPTAAYLSWSTLLGTLLIESLSLQLKKVRQLIDISIHTVSMVFPLPKAYLILEEICFRIL